jgi:DnaJ-class molecular chaperone
MTTTKTYLKCPKCNGAGGYEATDVNHQPITVNPCEGCNGTGYYETGSIDITSLSEQLDYIHGKVTAIWNKVK